MGAVRGMDSQTFPGAFASSSPFPISRCVLIMPSLKVSRETDQTDRKSIQSIAFVVPARNEQRHLRRCLESIQLQTSADRCDLSCKVIVVDNQSTDATPQIARECGADVIEVEPGKP